MNTNHALIIVTIVSIIIGIDTRIDVVAVIGRYIKVRMIVRFPLFLYISLRVANECEQVLHCDDCDSLGGRSALLVLPEGDLDGHVVGKMWGGIRWGAGWRALVKIGRGVGSWSWVVGRYVELRSIKGVLTVQLYSTKMYSHPTVYVYSKRLA